MASVDLTRKIEELSAEFRGAHLRALTTRVAVRSKDDLTKAISPKTLSHYGRRGKKGSMVKARFDLVGDSTAVMKPTPPGLSALLEKGSGTTWKAAKRRGSARRKRGTVGSYTRRPVPARGAWSKGVRAMKPNVAGYVHNEVTRALGKVF